MITTISCIERMVEVKFFDSIFGRSADQIPSACNVEIEKYTGTWYEIVRLPHSFEKDLENVTATYNLQNDGRIEVINQGFKNGEKRVVKGVAWVPDKNCTGKLFVRFFWLFKSEYKIILLDEKNYKFAVVTSNTMNYLWILSREPKISDKLYNHLISYVSSQGFDVTKIIKVSQD